MGTAHLPHPGQQAAADTAAAVSVATAGWTWLAHTNEVLQLFATLVAIGAGAAALWYHTEKANALRKARLRRSTHGDSQPG